MSIQEILQKDEKFRYELLERLKSDCDYYLGYGNRGTSSLWAGNVEEQIETMKVIWNSFPSNEKPEWLTYEQILAYEKEMTK